MECLLSVADLQDAIDATIKSYQSTPKQKYNRFLKKVNLSLLQHGRKIHIEKFVHTVNHVWAQ